MREAYRAAATGAFARLVRVRSKKLRIRLWGHSPSIQQPVSSRNTPIWEADHANLTNFKRVWRNSVTALGDGMGDGQVNESTNRQHRFVNVTALGVAMLSPRALCPA
jgi:hypothetical protein